MWSWIKSVVSHVFYRCVKPRNREPLFRAETTLALSQDVADVVERIGGAVGPCDNPQMLLSLEGSEFQFDDPFDNPIDHSKECVSPR